MDQVFAAVARSQCGVFSRAQALECGYSPERIRTELRTGRWFTVVPGVYRLAGSPGGWNTRVWSALLAAGPGAVLAGRPAGRLHRIDGVPGYDRLAVAVPANRRPRSRAGADVARVPLTRRDVGRRSGIPVLSAPRTVIDLARREPVEVGARIIADALRTGAANEALVTAQLAAAHGRDGLPRARAAFMLADPFLESVLEGELLELLTGAGLVVTPQFEVVQFGAFIARLDFAIEGLRLGYEADGYGVHSLRPAFERDHERHALLELAGWTTLSFTATQIRQRPRWVQDVARRMEHKRRLELGKVRDAYCG
jgi:very-short-patch-repair endonuclease